ncbi:MAG: carboxypeptidase regulatory-like domain-containing protein, partial [Acidobacteriaceae bacterium]
VRAAAIIRSAIIPPLGWKGKFNMSGKSCVRAGFWIIPLLALALAGCNKNSSVHRSSAAVQAPAHVTYTEIASATAGSISGTIHFRGDAPTPIVIDMAQDPACNEGMKTPNTTEQYVVHDGRLANVFVYIKSGLGNRRYKAAQTPVVLDQRNCRYVPHVIGAMAGQPVEFRNSDRTMHNVHIVPPGSDDSTGFDISQPPMAGTEQHVFCTAGLMIPIRCNNHPWMEAFLNVVDNPFFAVSDANGKFEIHGLPPGTYTLVAVQEKLGAETQTIAVEARKTSVANFTFSK